MQPEAEATLRIEMPDCNHRRATKRRGGVVGRRACGGA
jgi:hypothetical protein